MVPSIHTSHERQARRDTYPTIISWPRCPLPPRPSPLTHSPTTHRLLLRKHSRRRGARQSGPENSKSCWAQGGGGRGRGGEAQLLSLPEPACQKGGRKYSWAQRSAPDTAPAVTRRTRPRSSKPDARADAAASDVSTPQEVKDGLAMSGLLPRREGPNIGRKDEHRHRPCHPTGPERMWEGDEC